VLPVTDLFCFYIMAWYYKSVTDTQLVKAFTPTLIRISNDSSKHAHHTAMRAIGGGGGETRKSNSDPWTPSLDAGLSRCILDLSPDERDIKQHQNA
jgi:hypothetical protein